ncbi:MAG: RagB/SusD family nutrient uptake outer membrane protein [Winogradskyella sp.]|uniref:RagB/SusD family nutrient uptake outer membrane protein n=1 Tax=Winogradskyella sp. TaxID=1883156 RepID=UPI0017C62E0E|nr:RagB/SusD family nutrient uptake outer membrane protein [Winogradskyella sp.]
MKKNVLKLIGIGCLALSLQNCGDDFLNTEPSQFVTEDQLADAAELNPDLIAGSIDGIYTVMFTSGSGNTGGHDDFGQKAYDVFSDMLCSDMALSGSVYGWYRSSITEMQGTVDFTFTDNFQTWSYYYRQILNANLAMGNLGGENADPQNPEVRALLGQTLASRAHSYFMLTQLFADDYNPSQPILPIYREPTGTPAPKSTTAEVFELIESDLNRAIELLDGFNRTSKAQIDQPVAKGILAYAIAAQRTRWNEVAALASQARTESGTVLMPDNNTSFGILGGFNDVNNPSWMWGVDINENSGVGLVSWWGQIDYFSYSYAAVGDTKSMDQGLYESMRSDDVRRQQFFDTPGGNYLQPLFKQYDADRVPFGTSTQVKADYVYMRHAEMILLQAEAEAKQGMDVQARQTLKLLIDNRIDDTTYVNTLSGQALIDEIYKQTRLELWGEGKSYFAMKRNQATITRGANHLSFVGATIPHNDNRLTFEIPQREIQDNPFIDDQN